MSEQPIAYLGLLPMLPYLICLYVAYRMPHVRSGGFWRWIVGWAAFGLFTILFAIARLRVILYEAQGHAPFDWTRFALVSVGSSCLLVFVLALRWSFPNSEHTVWDDICLDAKRLASIFRRAGY